MENCVDVVALFGRRFRIGWEADGATRYQWPEAERVWLREICCRRGGRIYPIGGDRLGAFVTSSRVRSRLLALAGATSHGAEEVRFPLAVIEDVFAIMRPIRRRPPLSAEHKAKLIAAGARHHFRHGSKSDFPEPETTIAESAGNSEKTEA